jgi:DNA end-binding protein Ku
MTLRSIANATIKLGLVRIPVRVHAATEAAEEIKFNLLHADCGGRLRQQYVCAKDGLAVERDQAVRGYEFMKGHYVTFTAEEQKALEETSTQTIALADFVDEPLESLAYVERCYFLTPDKGADRAYRLLVAALDDTGRAAIGQFASRGKMHLVMLTPSHGRLLMVQLHYAPEVRSIQDVELEYDEVDREELHLVKQLMSRMRRRGFDLRPYRDSSKDRVRAQIQRKIDGQEITVEPPADETAPIANLLEALRASLAAAEPRPRRRTVGVTRA